MKKGWVFKSDIDRISKSKQYADQIEAVIFPAAEIGEIKKFIENIHVMARNDPEGLAGEIIKDSEKALKILEGGE